MAQVGRRCVHCPSRSSGNFTHLAKPWRRQPTAGGSRIVTKMCTSPGKSLSRLVAVLYVFLEAAEVADCYFLNSDLLVPTCALLFFLITFGDISSLTHLVHRCLLLQQLILLLVLLWMVVFCLCDQWLCLCNCLSYLFQQGSVF